MPEANTETTQQPDAATRQALDENMARFKDDGRPTAETDLQEGLPAQNSTDPNVKFTQADMDAANERIGALTETVSGQEGLLNDLARRNSLLNEQITDLKAQIEDANTPAEPPVPYPDADPAPIRFATPEAEIAHLKGQADAKLAEAHGFIQRLEVLLHNRAPSAIFTAFHRATSGMNAFLADL